MKKYLSLSIVMAFTLFNNTMLGMDAHVPLKPPSKKVLRTHIQTLTSLLNSTPEQQQQIKHWQNQPQGAKDLTIAILAGEETERSPLVMYTVLASGADPHTPVLNQFHDTPLHLAAKAGNVMEMALLLMFGANPNAVNGNGSTPLCSALQQGINIPKHEVAKLLLKYKANPNIATKWGHTPLLFAVQTSTQHNLVKLLLKKGANPNTKNIDQLTPLQCARQDAAIIELLKAYGAQE